MTTVFAQWGPGGSEEDYERAVINQRWETTTDYGWAQQIDTTYTARSAFADWVSPDTEFFADHGFAAWVEFQAPFEHYGEGPVNSRYTPSEYYSTSQSAVYDLGNQPPYSVPMGPLSYRFNGGRVKMVEGGDSTGSSCNGLFNYLYAYTGWAGDITKLPGGDPRGGDVTYQQGWLKGYLTRHVVEVDTGAADSCGLRSADYVYRYQYHSPDGHIVQFYQRPGEVASHSSWSLGPCGSRTEVPGPQPTSYISDSGSAFLDTTNSCRPVIIWSNGSVEEFHRAETVEYPASLLGTGAAGWDRSAETSCGTLHPLHITDRNGNVTTFTYTDTTETLTDNRGRVTTVTFQPSPVTPGFQRLLSVEVPSPGGGAPLKYTVNWRANALGVNFAAVWPDVNCHNSTANGGVVVPCGTSYLDLVDSITIPDGRSYVFSYTPWGGLDAVTEPGGAARKYVYGGPANTTYAQNALPLVNRVEKTLTCGPLWTGETVKVQARGVTSESVYPRGLGGGVVETTSIGYEKVDLGGCAPDVLGAATTGPDGCVQVWKVVTRPDNSKKKIGTVARALPFYPNRPPLNSGPPSPHGWEIGTEVWAPGGVAPLSSSYNGDKGTGELFYEFETAPTLRMSMAAVVDRRSRKAVNVTDGVRATNIYAYGDTIDVDPGPNVVLRNTLNLTKSCVWSGDATGCNVGSGTKLVENNISFYHPDAYLQRNLLHLKASETLTDPERGLLRRTDYGYDEYQQYPRSASGTPSAYLDTTIGDVRGNATTVTSYRDPASAGRPVSTHAVYFDTGDVRQNIDGNGRATAMSYDFQPCSTGHNVLTSTVTNAKGHVVTTVSDCYTNLPLRVTDPNLQSTFTQYDNLGRVVETAVPGDSLSSLPQVTSGAAPPPGGYLYLRDPNIPPSRLSGSASVGSAGQGPTTWVEYLSLGVIDQQRVVSHTKDGSSDGLYVKTFTDGLGRTIQTRSEVDPTVSSGNREARVTTEYDPMGRVFMNHAPVFAGAKDTYEAPPQGEPVTVTTYDALGRVKTTQQPGLPAVTADYDGNGTEFSATFTDAKGYRAITFTDVLGRKLRVLQESKDPVRCTDAVLGNWCVTVMTYDAAGQVQSVTDPASNVTTFAYDGLGRKTHMNDPDMGGLNYGWDYDYDGNGNLTYQKDAKGQVINLYYDELNRLKFKDLPPNGAAPGPEDTTYFYDGEPPPP